MKAELLSIGTELLLGQIVDTNANYLAGRLALLGIDCLHMQTVGDNFARAKQAFERALSRSDLVVATGGLGPTEDDLTREAIAAALGETPAVDAALEADLVAWFSGRGIAMPERNRKQAWLIPSAHALPNPNGTAPGWDVQKDGKRIVAMPGVPREMTPMWESVEASLTRGGSLRWRTLKLLGIGESAVEEKLAELVHSTSPTVATYAKNDGVHVRVADKASTPEEADRRVAAMEQTIRERLGEYVWGTDDETLASVIGRGLTAKNWRLAVAVIGAGLVAASRFGPGSDPWLAMWLALSSAGAIYSWSYDHVLLFVPLVIASGALAAAGREQTARRLAIGGALTLLLVSPVFYAIGVLRHDETFSIAVPVAFFVAIAWSLWPYRRGMLVRERSPQQVQTA